MNLRLVASAIFALALGAGACAQDANPAAPDNQASGAGQGPGMGQRGGRGMGMGMGMMGRGVSGTVTEVAADHFTVKTFLGDTYTVRFSANTRFMKGGGMGGGNWRQGGGGRGEGGRGGGNPPETIKASEIKVGSPIMAMGDIDASAKSMGAMGVVLLDPERAKEMQQMEADYGKTWLMGKVTAIEGTKITLLGGVDNTPHAFVADENTTFRERRDPVTLADVKVGDMVRVDGAVKGGVFTAAAVNVMRMQGDTPRVPRDNQQ